MSGVDGRISAVHTASVDRDVLVIGAGPAGLAVAACLLGRGVRPLVIDQAPEVGASWRGHYDRLHLHTVKSLSALPGLPFAEDAPRYVSRKGVADYLCRYARHHRIDARMGHGVLAIEPDSPDAGHSNRWAVTLVGGQRLHSGHVVVATGASRRARIPALAGLADFKGRVLHSREYRNADPFSGQRVLVVGMGNSGAEIALDLAERGVPVAVSVRSPLNIVRREVLGRPTQLAAIALGRLPPAVGDRLATLIRDLTVGDLSRWGIRSATTSPLRQVREEGRTPVIDVGTVARIKSGDIVVHPGIVGLFADGARFVDGTMGTFDAIVLATGYTPALKEIFPRTTLDLDDRQMPRDVVGRGALAGIYFVGFDTRQSGGQLRAIARQAQMLAPILAGALAAGR